MRVSPIMKPTTSAGSIASRCPVSDSAPNKSSRNSLGAVAQFRSLVEQISELHKKGIEVILVSSGAIVFGMGEINARYRPGDVASLQALAAIGQTVLMDTYGDLFKKSKIKYL